MKFTKSNEIPFWITNISNRNVSLLDLGMTIKARSSVNLMDSRHHHFTLEQIDKSVTEGSIFKKGSMIKVRKVPPGHVENFNQITISKDGLPSRAKTLIKIVVPDYKELNISDEAFANENFDLAENDRLPLIKK